MPPLISRARLGPFVAVLGLFVGWRLGWMPSTFLYTNERTLCYRAMYVTPPSTTSSILSGDGRLSAHAAGIGTALQRRSQVPGLSVCAALAAGLCLSGLRRWRVGDPAGFVALRPLRSGNFGHGGDDFSKQKNGPAGAC